MNFARVLGTPTPKFGTTAQGFRNPQNSTAPKIRYLGQIYLKEKNGEDSSITVNLKGRKNFESMSYELLQSILLCYVLRVVHAGVETHGDAEGY